MSMSLGGKTNLVGLATFATTIHAMYRFSISCITIYTCTRRTNLWLLKSITLEEPALVYVVASRSTCSIMVGILLVMNQP
ncbi:hypothetical protein BKA82DRAFT_4085380, partial [Pisolithus tinctorius]